MKEFRLTQDHIKLLQRANISWNDCEFGAPEIDPKRPYGNSDVLGDIAKTLNIIADRDDDGEFSPTVGWTLRETHRETATALKIILSTGSFTPGLYQEVREYSNEWKRIRD